MDALVTLLIGHRGTGKTSFLRSLKGVRQIDLDEEIERVSGQHIPEILRAGEATFRNLERTVLENLVRAARERTVIAVGAGCEGPLPDGAQVVWLRRATDSSGRCFLDRPRLSRELSPFAEYCERYFVRQRRFADWAHEELMLPEGYDTGLEDFVTTANPSWSLPYDLTLLPENFRAWESFYRRREPWGLRRWEIRDDLLSEEQIAIALATIPHQKIIFARRKPGAALPKNLLCDWALELGEPPADGAVISLHESEEDFESALARLSRHQGILKLAVEVADFTELKRGHEWWLEDPGRRAFLPRSPQGRWRWYRSLFGPRMPIHFFREGQGSSADQPLLWQTLFQPPFEKEFAAVLGHPVEHSRSPWRHRAFFKMPFVNIDIPEDEFTFAVDFLNKLGLRCAAVTAPLKKMAWAQAHRHSSEARRTQSANTLYFKDGSIYAHNTDVLALQEIRRELGEKFRRVWLWGGGGVKTSVKAVWPEAVEVSARQGSHEKLDNPDLVIWATGRSRSFLFPPRKAHPLLILDLNYSDDSPGLEWAVRENLHYQSGLRMFNLQADFQQEFWKSCEKGEL